MNKEEREKLEEAKAKYKEPWWESDDPDVLFLGQIQEKTLIIDLGKFHKAAEQALGRPVWIYEFVKPEKLLDEYHRNTRSYIH